MINKTREAVCAGFAWILVTTYILVRYQTSLDLKGSAWLTFATCLLMLGLAIDTGLQSEYQKKNILSRQLVMGIWAFIQVLVSPCCRGPFPSGLVLFLTGFVSHLLLCADVACGCSFTSLL